MYLDPTVQTYVLWCEGALVELQFRQSPIRLAFRY